MLINSSNFNDIVIKAVVYPCLIILIFTISATNFHASEIRGKPYESEFHFTEIRRKRDFGLKTPRTVILPVISSKNRTEFEKRAFKQMSKFFRQYNFVVPSYIEIDDYLRKNEIDKNSYEDQFDSIAKKFEAKYVVYLKINRISRLKKINAAGTLVAGATVTGVGRYAAGEYVLKVFNKSNKEIRSFSAIERRKDHILGLFQSAKRLALKLQDDTLQSLLSDFAQQKIQRSEGYILTPIQSYFPDAKGFQ